MGIPALRRRRALALACILSSAPELARADPGRSISAARAEAPFRPAPIRPEKILPALPLGDMTVDPPLVTMTDPASLVPILFPESQAEPAAHAAGEASPSKTVPIRTNIPWESPKKDSASEPPQVEPADRKTARVFFKGGNLEQYGSSFQIWFEKARNFLAATVGDQNVGMLGYHESDDALYVDVLEKADPARLEEPLRGSVVRGVARSLLAAAAETAGSRRLLLKPTGPSKERYRKLGFVPVSEFWELSPAAAAKLLDEKTFSTRSKDQAVVTEEALRRASGKSDRTEVLAYLGKLIFDRPALTPEARTRIAEAVKLAHGEDPGRLKDVVKRINFENPWQTLEEDVYSVLVDQLLDGPKPRKKARTRVLANSF